MALADDLAALTVPKAGLCKFGAVLEQLTADERRLIDEAFDAGATSKGMQRVLNKNGHAVSDDLIRRHRKSECACVPR